jgi:hypothetical protein
MFNLAWSGIVMLLLISGCGWNGTPTRNNDFIPLASIEISAVSPTIDVSRTIAAHTSTTLSVKGNFSASFTRDVTDQVVWSSSSPAVAGFVTATNPNRVTALAPGTAILTATVGGVSAAFTLTVSPAIVTTLTITPAAPSIFKGLTTQLSVLGTFSDGTTQDLNFDADWASTAPAVATVSNSAAGKGFVQAVAVGTTTITATFSGTSGSTLLTVKEPVLQSITVTPVNPSLLSLSSGIFKVTGNYSDGSTPDITSQASLSSSNTAIATIDGSGAVTTLLQGTTTISASMNGVTGTSNLRVTGGNLTGITLTPATVTLVKGTVGRIKATGTFISGNTSSVRDITGAVTWTPANTDIVTVTTPGGNVAWLSPVTVTPVSVPTTVTAKHGTVTAAATLTVTAPQLQLITISPTTLDLAAGTGSRLSVQATFNGEIHDVTANANWTSRAETIATVGNADLADKGRVKGVAAGITTISASYGGLTAQFPATVTVTQRLLQSLTISGPSSITAGNQVAFTALATYSDGTSRDVTEADGTTWSIDNSNVAIPADSRNQPGQVVAVDSGLATLTASFGDKTQKVTITVP